MSWSEYSDLSKFLSHYEDYLLKEEAKNNMLLQSLTRAIQNPSTNDQAFVSSEGTVAVLVDSSLIFSTETLKTAELVSLVREHTADKKIQLKKVMAPEKSSRSFVREWLQANKGTRIEKEFSMLLQKLVQVTPFERASGIFRRAWIEELDLLGDWTTKFFEETGVGNDSPISERDIALQMINGKRLFVWGNPKPVAMVGIGGSTPKGIRVNCVYTPPEERGHGFAKSAVAALSDLQLSQGKEFVVLYNDATQPHVTALYNQIGYEPIDNHFTYFFSSI